jgi:hypothetical protein
MATTVYDYNHYLLFILEETIQQSGPPKEGARGGGFPRAPRFWGPLEIFCWAPLKKFAPGPRQALGGLDNNNYFNLQTI